MSIPRILWRKVASTRNSVCGSLSGRSWPKELDWSEWWLDAWHTEGSRYLHVRRPDPYHRDNRLWDTYHRVRCRHSERPRLGMRKGELYWLVLEKEQA